VNLLVSSTGRFVLTPDGVLWGPPSLEYTLWQRYLEVFDPVKLLARARPEAVPPPGWKKASGPGVQPIALPHFVGAAGLMRALPALQPLIRGALAQSEAVMLRLPCGIGDQVWRALGGRRPYGVEVVGDPYEVFAPGATRHPLRPLVRWWMSRQLKRECARATAAAYVTAETLQRRYVPGARSFTTHFSSIEIDRRDFLTEPRQIRRDTTSFALVTVGTLQQLYKGPDVLIEAVHHSLVEGLDVRLILVGDGKHRSELEARARSLGLDGRVRFVGELPSGSAVREELDRADLFVLPSRTEGLPRAMIEAMARGIPCIGTTAGGIPELLPAEDMVPPGNARALAAKIREVLSDPDRRQQMSARNLVTAQNYQREVLRPRRIGFYEHLRKATQAWSITAHR
jgi:glycosyltransferase involved in cell wall biosynthesis